MIHKIEIDWNLRSPHLQALTGIVRIDRLDFGMIDKGKNKGFPVRKEPHSLGYQNTSALFSRCKPLVDVMVKSYYDGMILADQSVEWFDECSRHNNIITLTMHD